MAITIAQLTVRPCERLSARSNADPDETSTRNGLQISFGVCYDQMEQVAQAERWYSRSGEMSDRDGACWYKARRAREHGKRPRRTARGKEESARLSATNEGRTELGDCCVVVVCAVHLPASALPALHATILQRPASGPTTSWLFSSLNVGLRSTNVQTCETETSEQPVSLWMLDQVPDQTHHSPRRTSCTSTASPWQSTSS